MRLVFFVHSIASDWNHGNAHFLRGLMDALARDGHEVSAWEPAGAWSLRNLVEDVGAEPVVRFAREFPRIEVDAYPPDADDLPDRLEAAVAGADAVVVHEWNEPEVVGLLGQIRFRTDAFPLLFHDTHHRAVSVPAQIARFSLAHYDGVLAFGESLRRVYLERVGPRAAWTFHEAADTRRFRPLDEAPSDDVVWIGNWGDEERTAELRAYWLGAARALPTLRFSAYGARYPDEALEEVRDAGVEFRGWAPSLEVPRLFARAKATIHVPRRLYRCELPGIPTIRIFEALACGIPLVSTPWPDVEGLFRDGDYAVAETPREMVATLERLVADEDARRAQAERGLETIRARHTCDHRARELLEIIECAGGGGC